MSGNVAEWLTILPGRQMMTAQGRDEKASMAKRSMKKCVTVVIQKAWLRAASVRPLCAGARLIGVVARHLAEAFVLVHSPR